MATYRTVEVDVYLDEWSDEDLIDELNGRGITTVDHSSESSELLREIWRLRRNGLEYDHLMDKFLYDTLGVVV